MAEEHYGISLFLTEDSQSVEQRSLVYLTALYLKGRETVLVANIYKLVQFSQTAEFPDFFEATERELPPAACMPWRQCEAGDGQHPSAVGRACVFQLVSETPTMALIKCRGLHAYTSPSWFPEAFECVKSPGMDFWRSANSHVASLAPSYEL